MTAGWRKDWVKVVRAGEAGGETKPRESGPDRLSCTADVSTMQTFPVEGVDVARLRALGKYHRNVPWKP